MYAVYQDGVDDGSIRVRTRIFPSWRFTDSLPLRTGLGDERLSIGALKFISDGSIQGYTACLCKGYHDRDGPKGPDKTNRRKQIRQAPDPRRVK